MKEREREPDESGLAKHFTGLLRCTLQVTLRYGVEEELERKIGEACRKMLAEGLAECREKGYTLTFNRSIIFAPSPRLAFL